MTRRRATHPEYPGPSSREKLAEIGRAERERAVEYNRRWRERNREYVERYNLSRRTPPVRLVCSECGCGFLGRKDRETCSDECRRRRKVRLDSRWEPGRRALLAEDVMRLLPGSRDRFGGAQVWPVGERIVSCVAEAAGPDPRPGPPHLLVRGAGERGSSPQAGPGAGGAGFGAPGGVFRPQPERRLGGLHPDLATARNHADCRLAAACSGPGLPQEPPRPHPLGSVASALCGIALCAGFTNRLVLAVTARGGRAWPTGRDPRARGVHPRSPRWRPAHLSGR